MSVSTVFKEVHILWIRNKKTGLDLMCGVFSTYNKAQDYQAIFRRNTWRTGVREHPEEWEFYIENCTLDRTT